MSLQDFVIKQICIDTDFPPAFAPLVAPSAFKESAPTQSALNLLSSETISETDLFASETGLSVSAAVPVVPTSTPPDTCPSPGDYEQCLLSKCCDTESSCSGGGTGSGGPCPDAPEECVSGCCCCDSAVIAENLSHVRCYDLVGASCNADGSGPAPGELFPVGCSSCTSACDLILQNQCNLLPSQSWWNLGPRSCICTCKDGTVGTYPDEWSSSGLPAGYISNYILGDGTDLYGTGLIYDEDGTFSGAAKWSTSLNKWESIADTSEIEIHTRIGQACWDDGLYVITSETGEIKAHSGELVTPDTEKYDLNHNGTIDIGDTGLAASYPYIAKYWNGSSVVELGRTDSQSTSFTAVVSFNDQVYFGMRSTGTAEIETSGGSVVIPSKLALWNGAAFSDTGVAISGDIDTLYQDGTNLYIATDSNIYRLNAALVVTNLTPAGIEGTVRSMIIYGGNLVAAGTIYQVNGVSCDSIAHFSGGVWSEFYGGTDRNVTALGTYRNFLIVGGWFTKAGGIPVEHLARFDGTDWAYMPGLSDVPGLNDRFPQNYYLIHDILEYDGHLRVGGNFTHSGGIPLTGDAIFYSELPGSGYYQSDCALHCAICGTCSARVDVQNTSCKYEFTISPSRDCCRDAEEETVLVGFWNHGSARFLDWQNTYLTQKVTDFYHSITDQFYVYGTVYSGSQALVAGLDPATPCFPCVEHGLTTCAACPSDCCEENLSNFQFLRFLADELCRISNLSPAANAAGRLRSEFVVFVHGFASPCDAACPTKPDDPFATQDTYVIQKMNDALKRLNGTLHVINVFDDFNPPCEVYNISSGLCECTGTRCTSDGINYLPVSTVLDPICYPSGCESECSGTVDLYGNCDIARVWGVGTMYNFMEQDDTSAIDNLFSLLSSAVDRPPASCQCTNNETYSVTLDSRNCQSQTLQICGSTIVVSAQEEKTVCCDEIGCFCSSDCPPFWYDSACIQPPECKCGIECLPVCNDGVLLFDTIEAAVEANWAHCAMHASGLSPEEAMISDCIWIDFAQEWEEPNLKYICKADLENEIEVAWNACVGGQGGGGDGDGGDDGAGGGGDEDDEVHPGDGAGPVNIPGCGIWPPTNVDCSTDVIIGQEEGTVSVRHPDVVVLNNGIGLVAYEDTGDESIIKIKQLHTSIKNKVRPNRKLRYGRLQNPVRWSVAPVGFPAASKLCKLYHYEPTGNIVPLAAEGQDNCDVLFFLSGPFKNQVFDVYDVGTDSTGEYLEIVVPSDEFHQTSWNVIMSQYGSTEDDRYDVRWITYDKLDKYDDTTSDGCLIGSAPVPDGVDPDLDANVSDVDNILSLPPHYFDGQKVPVAYPSITKLDNYDNENENSHYVYVAYQALENGKWKPYLRQLRLSEFKKSSDVLLVESNLSTLAQSGIGSIKWRCRGSCIEPDCDGDQKSSIITSIWTAETEDGQVIYNGNLPLGNNSACGQSWVKNIVTMFLSQKTIWDGGSCPDADMLMNWKLGDTITTTVPLFSGSYDQDEINLWAQNNFNIGFPNLPVSEDITTQNITATLLYHSSQGGDWCVFLDNISTLTKYKGLYVSDPILIHESDGHCTRPVAKADYNNRVFVIFEETINGLQQIKLVGTSAPENALPIGSEAVWSTQVERFDSGFNFFFDTTDFSYVKAVTSSGTNQHPRMWIDSNNVLHLTWHSDKDNRWEVYYANSDNNFSLTRITDYDSKSLNPDITGNDHGDLFIVWHDNRFGPWEVMISSFEGSRIKPLFQQNEYLSSLRNRYTHSINMVPILITNTTNDQMCFKDIVVDFYADRLLQDKKFTVKRSVYPFAFSELFDLGTAVNEALTATEYCLNPGETKEFALTLTPDIFINPSLTSNSELTVGLKENQTYFTGVSIVTTSDALLVMPTQYQSTSCSDCTGLSFKYDYSSCVYTLPIINNDTDTKNINVRLDFYTDSALGNLVATISTVSDIQSFAIKGIRADNYWSSSGFELKPEERFDLQCYPALSRSSGLLCGVTYFISAFIDYGTEWEPAIFSSSSMGNTYWICNCQSVRWTDEAPTPISDYPRWLSSGFGYSDTRVTVSAGNSLNPKIRIARSTHGVILYQDDRHLKNNYRIYGSVFQNWPNSKMKASGTMHNADIFEAKSLVWEQNGPSEILGGQNPAFDIDVYANVFLAYEMNQSQNNATSHGQQYVFNDNTQSVISVHKCGYLPSFGTDLADPCSAPAVAASQNYITSYSAPDVGSATQTIKKARVSNEQVRYHITRNGVPTPVVKNITINLDVVGSPETIAVRFKNETSNVWSDWIPFNPSTGDYTARVPWQLSYGNGLKTIYIQLATYQGLVNFDSMQVIADYDTIEYSVAFYYEAERTEASKLTNYENVPIASVKTDATTQNIYVDISVSDDYLSKIDPANTAMWPKFSVFTQSSADILYKSVDAFTTTVRGKCFEGQFVINKHTSTNQDGVAMLVPHFYNDPSSVGEETLVEIDKFNLFSDKRASSTGDFDRDEIGRIKYAMTSRNPEDPYMVFGDPNYRLHQEN